MEWDAVLGKGKLGDVAVVQSEDDGLDRSHRAKIEGSGDLERHLKWKMGKI